MGQVCWPAIHLLSFNVAIASKKTDGDPLILWGSLSNSGSDKTIASPNLQLSLSIDLFKGQHDTIETACILFIGVNLAHGSL